MTDVQKRIERARELDMAATPGPWKHDNVQLQNAVIAGPGRGVIVPWGCLFEDAAFIAESRTLLPALSDDCEALKIELTAARSDLAVMAQERQGLREELARVRRALSASEARRESERLENRASAIREALGAAHDERNLVEIAQSRQIALDQRRVDCENYRAQLARYEQAGLPEEIASAMRSLETPLQAGAIWARVSADDLATVLTTVRKLQAERDALAERLRERVRTIIARYEEGASDEGSHTHAHLLDDKAGK